VSNLAKRLISAAVLIPFLFLLILYGRPVGVWLVVFAVTLVTLDEFLRMTLSPTARVERFTAMGVGALFSASLYWAPDAQASLSLLTVAVVVLFAIHLASTRDMNVVGARVGTALLGILYIGLLLTPVALLGRRKDGDDWLFLTLSMVFLGDTGGYFAGRFRGRRKLAPDVSPSKTVEGSIGGILAAVGAVAFADLTYMPQLRWIDWLLLAIPAEALAQVGDLSESMIKRGAGVKDSGWIMPGHGGMLDRIDGLLFAAPYVYFYARWAFG
jgi:phosphatidate cytidylyltransferase